MALEFSPCEQDRDRFGLPEWVTFDKETLDEVPFDQLDPWDREMAETLGCTINTLLAVELLAASARSMKGLVWLSCKLQDVAVPPLSEFNLKTRKVRMRSLRPDAGPPDPGSSGSPSEESPSATD